MKLPEPVAYQYRWTNPGDKPDTHPSETEWKSVELNHYNTIQKEVALLKHYSYNNRPQYEVRQLFTTTQVQETIAHQTAAIQQALDHLTNLQPKLANGLLNDRQLRVIDAYLDEAIKSLKGALE